MIGLRSLEAQFLHLVAGDAAARQEHTQEVLLLEEADGMRFLCPRCFEVNEGPIGTHSILVWFRDHGVPPNAMPGPGRWTASGTTLDDLTLAPSILLTTGCMWHGWVRNGTVTDA